MQLYGDLLGKGKDGVLSNNGGTWYYYTWNGGAFTGVSTGLPYVNGQNMLADINGDGLPDFISGVVTTVSTPPITTLTLTVNAYLNTGAGASATFSTTAIQAYTYSSDTALEAAITSNTDALFGTLRGFDFNGDGRQDLSLQLETKNVPNCRTCSYSTNYVELISTGTGFTATPVATIPLSATATTVTLLNFNSDNCTDYLVGSVIYLSGCNGTIPATLTVPTGPVIGAMDWNGDGRTDILVQNGSTIGVYLSTENGLSALVTTSIPYNASNLYFSFDADGDGLDDLGGWTVGASGPVTYYLHNGAGQKPDLMSSVTDGYGNSVSPAYVSLTQGVNGTYFETNDAQFPYRNYNGSIYLTRQAIFSDPSSTSGGTYSQNYYYSGLWLNLQGRGFTPFYNVQTNDSRNGTWDTVAYQRAFPYTGMFAGETLTSNNASSGMLVNHSATHARGHH